MLIVVPLCLIVLFSIPGVQNFAARKAAAWASAKLGTEVSIGNIDWKLFNRVVIDRLYVGDHSGDTLLYAGRVSAMVNDPGIFGGGLRLGKVELDEGKFFLRRDSNGVMNLRSVLDPLRGDTTKTGDGSFRLEIASVEGRNLSFGLRKFDPPVREWGMNYGDIGLRGIDVLLGRFVISGDSISAPVKRLRCHDKGGFILDSLSSGLFAVTGRGLTFDGLSIDAGESHLRMNYLRLLGESWESYGEFLDRVVISSDIRQSTVSFATISYFAPSLRGNGVVLRDLDAVVEGPLASMSGDIFHVSAGEKTYASLYFDMSGLPDFWNTRMEIDIRELRTAGVDADMIAGAFTGRELNLSDRLRSAGTISLEGKFIGTPADFVANTVLRSDHGGVTANIAIRPGHGGRKAVSGNIAINGIDLGALLDDKSLGKISARGNMAGYFGNRDFAVTTDATLLQLEYGGYTYRNTHFNGTIGNMEFTGTASSADPNLSFGFRGRLDLNGPVPVYDFDLQLDRADLARLGINRRDSVSVLRCGLRARGSGHTLDDLNGMVLIDSLLYVNGVDSVRTGLISLTGKNNAESKSLVMRSSFADAEFRSRMSYSEMFDYLKRTVASYLPALKGSLPGSAASGANVTTAAAPATNIGVKNQVGYFDIDNFSMLKVDVKEANNVAGIFLPGLQIAKGTALTFTLNPRAEKFTLRLVSDYIQRGNELLIANVRVDSENRGDSVRLYVAAEDIYSGAFRTPGLTLHMGMKQNAVNASFGFNNTENNTGARIGLSALFGNDPSNGAPQVTLRITSSSMLMADGRMWRIRSRDIVCDTSKVSVDNFRLVGSGQELVVNGTASRGRNDTLHVTLSNFDLSPLTQFTARHGYSVEGVTNGYADVVSALGGMILYSNINFDSVKVSGVGIPPLRFESRWDAPGERARFLLTRRPASDTVAVGYFRPGKGLYRVDTDFKGLDLSLLDPLLSGVVFATEGSADAKLTVVGGRGARPSINGAINIAELATSVDFTKVRYTSSPATMTVTDNVFSLRGARLSDAQGNRADMDLVLDIRNFGNIVYDVNVRPRDILALNTTIADNDIFYGKVYASGTFSVKGNKRGVAMNINATTSDDSRFFMPMRNKSDIAEADFIKFESASAAVNVIDDLALKRIMFSRRGKKVTDSAKSDLDITMLFNVRPNTEVQLVIDPKVGDIIKARGNGTFSINLDPRNDVFTMYGDYGITEGSYLFTLQNIINKRFIIEPGSRIRWDGDPANAILDISALYKVKASLAPLMQGTVDSKYKGSAQVDCIINMSDRLSRPTVAFDVQLPSVDAETQALVSNILNTQEMKTTQFFWLLAVNSFFIDNNAGSQNIGTMGSAVTGLEFLSNQLSNWISSDKYNIGIRYRPKSDFTSEEFDIDFSMGLAGNRLQLDVEGNYDFENNSAAVVNPNANNLTGDFYLTWLIDRAGNLKAKGFSRTIDSFDENQGLQENGIGIYYKEDFNNFKDIIRNLRERFGRKKERKQNQQTVTHPIDSTGSSKRAVAPEGR